MFDRCRSFLLAVGLLGAVFLATTEARGAQPGSFDMLPEGVAAATWTQVASLAASDGVYLDRFGYAVAISGDIVVVGAYADDDDGARSGSAYVFERNLGGAGNWGQRAKLTASDADTDDFFGRYVDVQGDLVVVGAPYDEARGEHSGSAYVFARNLGGPDNWGQRKKLMASDAMADDLFGSAVAVDGATIVVGARSEDSAASNAGAAYVFEVDLGGPGNWGERTKLVGSELGGTDYFGGSLGISGDTIVVGAVYGDSVLLRSGTAYVFERDLGGPESWGERTILSASDPADLDLFGSSVSIDGDTLVVGAYGSDDVGSASGAAYVFERHLNGTDQWGERAKIVASDAANGDYFGWSVTVNGDTVVVGARNADGAGSDSGAAYIFERHLDGPDQWGERTKIIPGEIAGGEFAGGAVAIDDGTVVVGAELGPGISSQVGAAFLFQDIVFDDGYESGDCSAWELIIGSC